MKNKAIKVVGTIIIVGGMIFFATGIGAQGLDGRNAMQIRQIHPKMDDENENRKTFVHHIDKKDAEAIRKALENKDYDTWRNLIVAREKNLPDGAKSILDKINSKEAFEAFADRMATKGQMQKTKAEERTAIREKLEANDYEGWKVLVANREAHMENLKFSLLEKIDTEEKFAKLVKIHDLREEIHQLNEELGLLQLGRQHGNKIGTRR